MLIVTPYGEQVNNVPPALAAKIKAEPALALSLPDQPTESDDGLLKASEVAQLKLDADIVVLSACNTAAGDKPGAEALSGLARAFFYAGGEGLGEKVVGRECKTLEEVVLVLVGEEEAVQDLLVLVEGRDHRGGDDLPQIAVKLKEGKFEVTGGEVKLALLFRQDF